ncbi:hypothetical protein AKJ08_1508 [Vulgatibacter incomptus]|uniref:Uncharacterized protein n=1 Tax=Vulgatibacter incomptus TaxID=1391653 RepID=A0A0K1PCG8_9BACT|nr:hypothetical protein AKJ08_1508 [Vulgatibacter incomptus]
MPESPAWFPHRPAQGRLPRRPDWHDDSCNWSFSGSFSPLFRPARR